MRMTIELDNYNVIQFICNYKWKKKIVEFVAVSNRVNAIKQIGFYNETPTYIHTTTKI